MAIDGEDEPDDEGDAGGDRDGDHQRRHRTVRGGMQAGGRGRRGRDRSGDDLGLGGGLLRLLRRPGDQRALEIGQGVLGAG